MPKQLKEHLAVLVQIIARHLDGISVESLLGLLQDTPPKRTVQYRLATLVKAGIIRVVGAGRSSRYYSNTALAENDLGGSSTSQTVFGVPLSLEGQEVQKLISMPIQLRPHVGYRREFLDSYEPNVTFYLSLPILEKLFALGSGTQKWQPAGTYAKQIYQRLLLDLSWNSSRLEGNSYSLLETEVLLATGVEVIGKDEQDAQMILNHKDAIEFIIDMAEDIDISSSIILNIHGFLAHDLIKNIQARGRLRTAPVKIGLSVYKPIENPQLIEECFQSIVQKARAIKNPFEQSFFLMVQLTYLQPFIDINKRVARVVGNIPFIRENLSPLSFVDVPISDYIQGLLAIYELNRIELFRDVFVWAYERSASLYMATLESIGQPDPVHMRYRDHIRQTIYTVVHNKMNKLQAAQFIAQSAHENIPLEDRNRFIEIVESEVSGLHEGNFARFKIRYSQLLEWQKTWK